VHGDEPDLSEALRVEEGELDVSAVNRRQADAGRRSSVLVRL
jgi:hypothetical protein